MRTIKSQKLSVKFLLIAVDPVSKIVVEFLSITHVGYEVCDVFFKCQENIFIELPSLISRFFLQISCLRTFCVSVFLSSFSYRYFTLLSLSDLMQFLELDVLHCRLNCRLTYFYFIWNISVFLYFICMITLSACMSFIQCKIILYSTSGGLWFVAGWLSH